VSEVPPRGGKSQTYRSFSHFSWFSKARSIRLYIETINKASQNCEILQIHHSRIFRKFEGHFPSEFTCRSIQVQKIFEHPATLQKKRKSHRVTIGTGIQIVCAARASKSSSEFPHSKNTDPRPSRDSSTFEGDTEGNIFDGFTPVKWQSRKWNRKHKDEDNCWKADDSLKSFRFTLKNVRSFHSESAVGDCRHWQFSRLRRRCSGEAMNAMDVGSSPHALPRLILLVINHAGRVATSRGGLDCGDRVHAMAIQIP
jgi:hypothetical protein